MPSPLATAVLALVPLALFAADELVLDVDPDTKLPLGELVEADGLILDPRDLPERIFPYIIGPGEGLEGVEASLTGLFGRSLGFALERKKLPKRYRDFCEHQAGQWEDLVDELLPRFDREAPGSLVGAALYHDTGRRIGNDQLRVVGPARIAAVAIDADELAALLRVQRLVALFGYDMTKEDAKELSGLTGDFELSIEKPWFMHATSHLMWATLGMLDEEKLANPWDMTPDEFLERSRQALREQLVDPLFPDLPDDVRGDDVWFLEGLVVGQCYPDDVEWDAPDELVDHNADVHQPILLVQVEDRSTKRGPKPPKRVALSMIAGGEVRSLYEGKWPLP